MADRAVVREAERGERLVATARVALTTSALILLGVNEGLPVLLGRGTVHGQGWIPVLLLPTALMGWIWLAILRLVP